MYEELVNTLNMGLVILDKDKNVRKWNQWMESHSDIKRSEIEGQNLCLFYRIVDTERPNRTLKAILTL